MEFDDFVQSHESSSSSAIGAHSGLSFVPEKVEELKSLLFPNKEVILQLYTQYAKTRGFCVRIKLQAKVDSKNSPTDYPQYITYVCNKEGKKRASRKLVKHPRSDTRCNCEALIKFKFEKEGNGYRLTEWYDEHTHPMIPPDQLYLAASNRSILPEQQTFIDVNLFCGASQRSTYETMYRLAGGRECLGFTRIDLKNHIRLKRQRDMLPGEATVLLNWFKNQSASKGGFFYDFQMDLNEEIASMFWADSLMIEDYALFGDFVSFDTTYRTNRGGRPLAIFVGFNHHKGTCVFGAALLYNETAETFKWLFQTFLRCIKRKQPLTFMTDQAPAIAIAAKSIFSESYHCLCSWHISRNAKKNLSQKYNSDFRMEFSHLINHVDNEDQFEYGWSELRRICFNSLPTSEIKWLKTIYPLRKMWSGAWVKNYFTAGKTTTQLSEQFNAFSRNYLKPQHSITQLFTRFQALLDEFRYNEFVLDFKMQNTIVHNNFQNNSIMLNAKAIYTPAIFKIIHQECIESSSFFLYPRSGMCTSGTQSCDVVKREDKFDNGSDMIDAEVVEYNLETLMIRCSCRFFENRFILCRHALKLMDFLGSLGHKIGLKIPEDYIKSRWTRNCKSTIPISSLCGPEIPHKNFGQRYQKYSSLMIAMGNRICHDEALFEFVYAKMVEASKEVDLKIKNTPVVEYSRADFEHGMDLKDFGVRDSDNDGAVVDESISMCDASIDVEVLQHDFVDESGQSDDADHVPFPQGKALKFKDREDEISCDHRLMPEFEKWHLKLKQKRKKDIQMRKQQHIIHSLPKTS